MKNGKKGERKINQKNQMIFSKNTTTLIKKES